MKPEDALTFVADNHRAVLMTRKASGDIQSSPITVGVEDDKLVISSRETAYKVQNMRRDPRASLCVFTDNFFGPWIQVDGTAEIVSLPDAMERLVDYYRNISGEHPDWDDYRRAMQDQQRVLVVLSIERVGPDKEG